jgi:hypothetical protein
MASMPLCMRRACDVATTIWFLLAVDFHDFYRQHFPEFHTFMAKITFK